MRPSVRLALTVLALAACGPARIETDPSTLQLHGRGQQARIHAVAVARNGRPLADHACAWSSSDERIATVRGPHNEATVTAVAQGRATIRCAMSGIAAEVPVAVTVVNQVEVTPRVLDLQVLDEPRGTPLSVRALDGEGREVHGRVVATRCADEDVCRGDARGQVWPVGPGQTKVLVQVDDGQGEALARVTDARTAAAKPRRVSGNPMEHLDDPAPSARRHRR